MVFFILYYVVGYRKRVVWENLTRAFPDKTKVEIKQIQKDFYRHMCDMFLEMVKTLNLSKEELKVRYSIVNIEVLQEIVKEKSVLIYVHIMQIGNGT